MSTLTPADNAKIDDRETPTSGASTLIRNSIDDMEKPQGSVSSEGDNPPEHSTIRLVLLVLGLCLSMFLVALDFVLAIVELSLTKAEYINDCDPKNHG